jgi:putative membrane protein
MVRLLLAWLHLLALGLGFAAIVDRAMAFLRPVTTESIHRALRADNAWGIAAILWIGTGLWRLFGETEKSLGYYMQSSAFWTKMSLLAVIFVLELPPMVRLIRWRVALGRGKPVETVADARTARRIAAVSVVQAMVIAAMVAAAVAMARGFGGGG